MSIKEATQQLRAYIKENQLRYTAEREVILNAIYKLPDMVSISQIMEQLDKDAPGTPICRSTFYNAIRLFLKANLLLEFRQDKKTVYAKPNENKVIVERICTNCKRVDTVDLRYLEDIKNICFSDFKTNAFRVIIHGTCLDCEIDKMIIPKN